VADHRDFRARREAMVRAMLAWKDSNWQFDPVGLVNDADDALRAIEETPVPEWAGDEHVGAEEQDTDD